MARPKSRIRGLSRSSGSVASGRPRGIRMFAGLMSRCTAPISWTYARVSASFAATAAASLGVSRRRARSGVEGRALHVVRDQDGPPLPLEDLVQGHDPRVPQAGDDPRLAGEAGQEVGGGAMGMRDLQGHDPVQLLVDRLPDRAVRPAPERLQQAIVADASRAGHQGRSARGSGTVRVAILGESGECRRRGVGSTDHHLGRDDLLDPGGVEAGDRRPHSRGGGAPRRAGRGTRPRRGSVRWAATRRSASGNSRA